MPQKKFTVCLGLTVVPAGTDIWHNAGAVYAMDQGDLVELQAALKENGDEVVKNLRPLLDMLTDLGQKKQAGKG